MDARDKLWRGLFAVDSAGNWFCAVFLLDLSGASSRGASRLQEYGGGFRRVLL